MTLTGVDAPPMNPIEVIHSELTYGGVEAGLLIDSMGKQHRFFTTSGTIDTARTWIDYQVLSSGTFIWITRSHELQC